MDTPFAFVGVYPAAFFLDKEIAQGFALLTPVVGVVFFSIGIIVWNFGVKRYRGAGSIHENLGLAKSPL